MHKLMIAAAAIAALFATSAEAETQKVRIVQKTIRYDRAELATQTGAGRLLRRITLRATRLCATRSFPRPGLSGSVRTCRDQAVARAVHEIAAPQVTAAFEQLSASSQIAAQ